MHFTGTFFKLLYVKKMDPMHEIDILNYKPVLKLSTFGFLFY